MVANLYSLAGKNANLIKALQKKWQFRQRIFGEMQIMSQAHGGKRILSCLQKKCIFNCYVQFIFHCCYKIEKSKLKYHYQAFIEAYVTEFSCIANFCEDQLHSHCMVCKVNFKIAHKSKSDILFQIAKTVRILVKNRNFL